MNRYRIPERLEDWPKWLWSTWLRLSESLVVKRIEGDHAGVFEDLLEFLTQVLCHMLAKSDKMLRLQDGPEVLCKIYICAICPIRDVLHAMVILRDEERRQEFNLLLTAQRLIAEYMLSQDEYLKALLDLDGADAPASTDAPARENPSLPKYKEVRKLLSEKLRDVRARLYSHVKKLARELPAWLSRLSQHKLKRCLMATLTDLTAAEDAHKMTPEEAGAAIRKAEEHIQQLKGLRGRDLAREAKYHLRKLRTERLVIESVYMQSMLAPGGRAMELLRRIDAWTCVTETGGTCRRCSKRLRDFHGARRDAVARKDAEAGERAKESARQIVAWANQLDPRGFPRAVKTLRGVANGLKRRYGW